MGYSLREVHDMDMDEREQLLDIIIADLREKARQNI